MPLFENTSARQTAAMTPIIHHKALYHTRERIETLVLGISLSVHHAQTQVSDTRVARLLLFVAPPAGGATTLRHGLAMFSSARRRHCS